MLNEKSVTAFTYDPFVDIVTLQIEGRTGGAGQRRSLPATLLLDAKGYLVGVDIDPEGAGRIVAMLGKHEDVENTRPARVETVADSAGNLCRVRIEGARLLVRANEKNPYVRRDDAH